MTDLGFIAGAYGVGAVGLVGYALSLARREHHVRARRAALDRQRERLLDVASPPAAPSHGERRQTGAER